MSLLSCASQTLKCKPIAVMGGVDYDRLSSCKVFTGVQA